MDIVYTAETYHDQQQHSLHCDEDDAVSTSLSQVSNETTGLSVRDMIRRYDTAAKRVTESHKDYTFTSSHQSLATAFKTANANGGLKGSVQPLVKQFVAKVNENEKTEKLNKEMRVSFNKRFGFTNNNTGGNNPNSNAETNSLNHIPHAPNMINNPANHLSIANQYSNQTTPQKRLSNSSMNNVHKINSNEQLSSRAPQAKLAPNHVKDVHRFSDLNSQATQLESNEILDEMAPIQTSYQSRTTISRSDVGVRITIDIFFDQESQSSANSTDIIGSRIETELPRSRILTEFQERTADSARNSGPY